MDVEIRNTTRALMLRYLAAETKEGLFHSLVLAQTFASLSVAFSQTIQGFPVCEISNDGDYLVNGQEISHWDISEGGLLLKIDHLKSRVQ